MSLLTEGTRRALDELGTCLGGIDEDRLGELAELLARSKRVVLYGCGREGLMMRALCMRLHHLGAILRLQHRVEVVKRERQAGLAVPDDDGRTKDSARP